MTLGSLLAVPAVAGIATAPSLAWFFAAWVLAGVAMEIVATAGLIAVIVALSRTGRASSSAAAVASWIGAAYWFTSSTSFANPAVTIARMFSDTFAGISPSSVPMFLAFQIAGAALGTVLVVTLYPDAVVVPPDAQPPHAAERIVR